MTTALAYAARKALASPDTPEGVEWKAAPGAILSSDDDTGRVRAIVSVTGVWDEVADNIVPGAYKRTLAERIPKGVWAHDWKTWCSRTDAIVELMPGDPGLPTTWKGQPWPKAAGALLVDTVYNLETQAGREAYSNVKFFDAGPLGQQVEFSIGYQVPTGGSRRDEKGRRYIDDITLFEYCPVLFGAMPLAGVVSIGGDGSKSLDERRVEGFEAALAGAALEGKVAGREATPKDAENTHRLMDYWAHGAGAAKIRWGEAGDFDRARKELAKYVHDPSELAGLAANLHHEATGFWPGHAPTEQVPGHGGGNHGHKELAMGDTTATGTPDDTQHEATPVDDQTAGGAPVQPADAGADDDADGAFEVNFDADADYPTEAEATEGKAAGKAMACGKSRAECTHTMSDDSYPVHNGDEVTKAVNAYPRGAGKGGKTKKSIRTHIVTRAKFTNSMSKVPSNWPEKKTVGSGTKSLEAKDFWGVNMQGSVESLLQGIGDALNEAFLPDPDENGSTNAYVSLCATYGDHVICRVVDYSQDPTDRRYWDVPYTVDDDDNVTLGDPTEVEPQVSLVPVEGGDGDGDAPGRPGAMPDAPPTPAAEAQKALDLASELKALVDGGATGNPVHLRRAADAVSEALVGFGKVPMPAAATADAEAGQKALQAETLGLLAELELDGVEV